MLTCTLPRRHPSLVHRLGLCRHDKWLSSGLLLQSIIILHTGPLRVDAGALVAIQAGMPVAREYPVPRPCEDAPRYQGEPGSIGGPPRFAVALLVEGKQLAQKEVCRCQHHCWT